MRRRILATILGLALLIPVTAAEARDDPPIQDAKAAWSTPWAKELLALKYLDYITQSADGSICFYGSGGADDTDFCVDLDGTGPSFSSPTDTTITIAEILAVNSFDVGGGYGSTGCSISATGVLQCDGAFTTDLTLTAEGVLVTGGGTGVDSAAAGILNLGVTNATSFVMGSVSVTDFNLQTDGAGDAEVVLSENSIGPDEVAVMTTDVVFCGQLANSGTLFNAPGRSRWLGDATDLTMGGAACDAMDNATEATADLPMFGTTAKVQGMYCNTAGAGANGIVITMRAGEADLTPSVTCTIPTGEFSCSSVTGSTTDLTANQPLAIQTVTTEDLSAQDTWCRVVFALK